MSYKYTYTKRAPTIYMPKLIIFYNKNASFCTNFQNKLINIYAN